MDSEISKFFLAVTLFFVYQPKPHRRGVLWAPMGSGAPSRGSGEMAAAVPQHRPGAELAPLRAKRGQRLPPGSHGRPCRPWVLARLQEAASDAAAEAKKAAEERTRCRRSPALLRGPAGRLRSRPPQPLLQPGQRAAGRRHPPAAGAAAATAPRVPLGSALLAGRGASRLPATKWGRRGEGRSGAEKRCRRWRPSASAPARSPLPRGNRAWRWPWHPADTEPKPSRFPACSVRCLVPLLEFHCEVVLVWFFNYQPGSYFVPHLTLPFSSAFRACLWRQARQESRALWKNRPPRLNRCTERHIVLLKRF